LQKVREAYELERMAHRVTCAEFIEDMAEALGWADLVICRAGALTVSELTAAGVGSVLVPYPHAIDDHQTANARTLSSRAAGILMPQSDLSPAALAVLLNEMTRERCLAMARAAHQPMEPPAAARLMHCILDLPEVAS
jgi:UDP-N-acetylglucosamine--N-acetylmuramyl-(pentapeptide) pyrophosphoryl-undecaprenol N-acetylglucosamine transferase